MYNKFFELFLNYNNFDSLCELEHYANSDVTKSIDIDRHTLKSCYCGLNHLDLCEIISVKNLSEDNHFNFVGLEIIRECEKNFFIILLLYRSPEGDVNIFFEKLEQTIDSITKHISSECNLVIYGDFIIKTKQFYVKSSGCFKLLPSRYLKLMKIMDLYVQPTWWNESIGYCMIQHILKTEDRVWVQNYRPMTLLSSLSIILINSLLTV